MISGWPWANTLAAIEAGVGQVECTINGIGERAGNAALEEIVMASRVRPQLARYSTNINSQEIFRTSQLLAYLTGSFPSPTRRSSAATPLRTRPGIHQHGVLQHGLTYEIIRPESVGIPRSTLVLGKHSGRHALERPLQGTGLRVVGGKTGASSTRTSRRLPTASVRSWMKTSWPCCTRAFNDAPEEYLLTHLRVVCGSVSAEATFV